MITIDEYMRTTKSAVKKLYQAINSYYTIINGIEPTAKGSRLSLIKRQLSKEKIFEAESLSMAILAGSILQFAHIAIDKYSHNIQPHPSFADLIPKQSKLSKYCIGREIKGVPIGLIIYAGRNQSQHYTDDSYHKITSRVFSKMHKYYDPQFAKVITDKRFDLDDPNIINYGTHILWILNWQNYNNYKRELLQLLSSKIELPVA